MKYERTVNGKNGRKWKITHELLSGPPPKGKKPRVAKPAGKKAATPKKSTKSAGKGKRRTAVPARANSSPKRGKRTTKRSTNEMQLRLLD